MAIKHSTYSGGKFPAYIINTADIITSGSVTSLGQIMNIGATVYDMDNGSWYIVNDCDSTSGSCVISQYTSPISGSF